MMSRLVGIVCLVVVALQLAALTSACDTGSTRFRWNNNACVQELCKDEAWVIVVEGANNKNCEDRAGEIVSQTLVKIPSK
ncbi:hypothetical protein ScPMuIL_002512 [Solemya velum]